MQSPFLNRGFTLIELLLVIGIIAVLAGIVILAINPTSQLLKAEDAKRVAHVRELKSAILQHQIEHGNVPNGITATTMPICRYGTTDPSCINLDVLVDEDYVTTLDVDASESSVLTTGYTVHQDPSGFTVVGATYLGVSGGGIVDSSALVAACINEATYPIPVGIRPFDISYTASKAYIVNSTTVGTISVIDLLSDQLITTISVGNRPNRSIIVGTKLYVTNFNSNTVTVINTETDTVLSTISLGTRPTDMYYINSKIYVTLITSGGISVISPVSDTVLTTIPVFQAQTPAVIGNKIYFPIFYNGTLSVVDSNTDSVITTLTVGTSPRFAIASGTKVYVGNDSSTNISVINSITDVVDTTISIGQSLLDAILVGNKLYVTSYYNGYVSIVNTTNDTLISSLVTGLDPAGILEVDGIVYVVDNDNVNLTLIDTDSDTITSTIALDGAEPYALAKINDKLYITNIISNSVSVLDLANNTLCGS